MPTNEERLDVARKLRCACPEQFNDILYGIHLANVGIKACAQIVSAHKDITVDAASRLADLIETEPERACKPNVWCDGIEECHGVYERWLAECGSCGAILSEASSEERVMICLPNYCPNCGAKVINDAD